jgi:HEAT repeat protein
MIVHRPSSRSYPVIASQADIRSRIEQVKLSDTGYRRQLALLNVSPERRERLETDVRLAQEEIATLETLAQLGRVEPDRDKVEAAARERLDAVRARMSSDPALSQLTSEEQDLISGEIRALLWALGEDKLTENMRILMAGHDQADPSRTDRAIVAMLMRALEEASSVETRASAAYDLGKLGITQAIPALAKALNDDPLVSQMALRALSMFDDAQLAHAGLPEATRAKARQAHSE